MYIYIHIIYAYVHNVIFILSTYKSPERGGALSTRPQRLNRTRWAGGRAGINKYDPRGCEKPLGAQTGVWRCGVVAAVLRRETFERACVLGKWFPSLRSSHATGHLPATRDSNIQTYPHILIVASLSCSLNSLSFCFDILHPLLILSILSQSLHFPIASARTHYTT